MAENFDITILLPRAPTSVERLALVKDIFRVMHEWLGEPEAIAVTDIETGQFQRVRWSLGSASLLEGTSPGTIRHVYGKTVADGPTSVTLDETEPTAAYTIAIPRASLAQMSDAETDDVLLELASLIGSVPDVMLIAGFETSIDVSKGLMSVVQDLLRGEGDVQFIFCPESMITVRENLWEARGSFGSGVLLRRRGTDR